jgi:HSP20 family molecular chaperone IbpA
MKLSTTSLRDLSNHPISDAWRSLTNFENQMEAWISAMSPEAHEDECAFSPACDIAETPHHYVIRFDIPGVKKEDLKIALEDNQLTVRGERMVEHFARSERIDQYFLAETCRGVFMRRFTLPTPVADEMVDALLIDGVLTITIAKNQEHHVGAVKVN